MQVCSVVCSSLYPFLPEVLIKLVCLCMHYGRTIHQGLVLMLVKVHICTTRISYTTFVLKYKSFWKAKI